VVHNGRRVGPECEARAERGASYCEEELSLRGRGRRVDRRRRDDDRGGCVVYVAEADHIATILTFFF
jgi:hypothetical protein